jgi:hypothetical protein
MNKDEKKIFLDSAKNMVLTYLNLYSLSLSQAMPVLNTGTFVQGSWGCWLPDNSQQIRIQCLQAGGVSAKTISGTKYNGERRKRGQYKEKRKM